MFLSCLFLFINNFLLLVFIHMLLDQNPPEKTLTDEALWPTLSVDELLREKNILFDRWEFLKSKGYSYADTVLKGIHKIDEIISTKL